MCDRCCISSLQLCICSDHVRVFLSILVRQNLRLGVWLTTSASKWRHAFHESMKISFNFHPPFTNALRLSCSPKSCPISFSDVSSQCIHRRSCVASLPLWYQRRIPACHVVTWLTLTHYSFITNYEECDVAKHKSSNMFPSTHLNIHSPLWLFQTSIKYRPLSI
jgi:hypothetical protein